MPWLCDRGLLPAKWGANVYRLLVLKTFDGPIWAGEAIETYAEILPPHISFRLR